ncbi:response regulator [Gilvimarinus sp. F26214L]|uniref:response regulator n=1 Tax=Gilvimarinus sp. DZF01 TaxID=3461371 RepID=UPI0040463E83
MTENNNGEFAVLFVDDEEKALKYFSKALAGRFPVYTAKDVDSAEEILESRSDEIAIVISDQRMPGRNGVELLKKVRQEYPGIVRLLTTAYSDLNDAIEAINRGEIYRYIQKPWHVESLQAEMVSAMRIFELRRERDLLLAEKLSARQRMTGVQRLSQLIACVQTAGDLHNAAYGLRDFLDVLHDLPGSRESDGLGNVDQWELTKWETRRASDFIRAVKAILPLHPVAAAQDTLTADQLLTLTHQVAADFDCEISVPDSEAVPSWQAGGAAAHGLLRSVFGLAANMEEVRQPIELGFGSVAAPYSGTSGIRLTYLIRGNWPLDRHLLCGSALTDVQPVFENLLAACLAASHLGGKLELTRREGETELAITLPEIATELPPLDWDWLTESLASYEPSIDEFYPDL